MSTYTNDTHAEVYLPTLGVLLQPGKSVDYVADGEVEPEPVVDLLPASKKATPKTDPAPEPADLPVPADTQES